MASLTVATKMSPIEAYRRFDPPSTLMQSTSLAPELSATRNRDSCWITVPPAVHGGSLGALQDFDAPPALQLRHRPDLGETHPVAHPQVIVLVVRVEPFGPLHRFGVPGVTDPFDDGHHRR